MHPIRLSGNGQLVSDEVSKLKKKIKSSSSRARNPSNWQLSRQGPRGITRNLAPNESSVGISCPYVKMHSSQVGIWSLFVENLNYKLNRRDIGSILT